MPSFALDQRSPDSTSHPGTIPFDDGTEAWGGLTPDSPEFTHALVSLLTEQLSLLMRAREHVWTRLQEGYSHNGHDLWEWRKVLDTYPLPRLLHLLRSDSPMAVRLRRSSPFPEVLSEEERERLQSLLIRPH